MNKRVLVGISGGIDSAVAAALLKTQGYEVEGIHLRLWSEKLLSEINPSGGSCCAIRTADAARAVCRDLEIPLHIVDASENFTSDVVDYVVHERLSSREPNPCVMCNSRVKFELMLKKADELRCDYIASGHYAKIVRSADGSETNLYRAADTDHDQSYFLFALRQELLARLLMPIGDLLKNNIRSMARTFELPAIERSEGKTLCLMGEAAAGSDGGCRALIQRLSTERYRHAGPVVTTEGQVLARHSGLYQFVIGQREGLGIESPTHKDHVVIGFDLKLSALLVGTEEQLKKKGLLAINCNWLGVLDFSKGLRAKAQLSAHGPEADCIVTLLNGNSVLVDFTEPQYAVAAGQAIVFYQEGMLLGGGWVEGLTEPVSTKLRGKSPSTAS